MKSFASLARLAVVALACGALVPDARGQVVGNEPPLFGPFPGLPVLPPPLPPVPPPVPIPEPDCLPKDPPPPVVKVKVRVPAFQAPGQPIEYRICVENCSTSEAHHVLLKNPLPANAKFVRADPEPDRTVPELQWQLGTIGGGACREVVLVLLPCGAEDVKNCTRVQFEHGVCVSTRLAAYPPGLPGAPRAAARDAPASGEPPIVPGPEPKLAPELLPKLALTVEGHKRQYVNLPSHYFITVTNNGKTKATNLLVSCVVPEPMKFERASANYKSAGGQVAWLLGDLEPGGKRTVEIVLRAQSEGDYCVRAAARADRGITAQAEACTQFVGVSAVQVALVDSTDPLVVGGRTSYSIVIRNQGSAPVTNLKVRALLPPALQLIDVKGPTTYQLGEKTARGQWIEIAPLARLEPMASQAYEIFVEGRLPGETRLHAEVGADQLERGPVIDEESTTLFLEGP